ncbi:MAG TPA: nuclear transport factor 2 family protein [Thermoleophilaceae bacterium]|jgi:ketosteroid isomerase-like protein
MADVTLVRRAIEGWNAERSLRGDRFTDDFVWDMSTFEGWTEERRYPGLEGARRFLDTWTAAWDQYDLKVEDVRPGAGGKVVADVVQHAVSPAGLEVEMEFAMVWTVRDGMFAYMSMFRDRAAAAAAAAKKP